MALSDHKPHTLYKERALRGFTYNECTSLLALNIDIAELCLY